MSLLSHVSRLAERRGFPLSLALLVCALATLAGCITIDGTLKADGSGTINVSYKAPPNSTETVEKRRLSSSQVKLDSFELKPDHMVAAKVSFDDPAKLSTLDPFRNATIKRKRDGEEELLTITIANPNPAETKDQGKPGPRIGITLPGKVLEAGRNGTVEGNRVTWSLTLVDYFKDKTIELTARYQVAAGDPAPPAEAPPKEKPADGKNAPGKP